MAYIALLWPPRPGEETRLRELLSDKFNIESFTTDYADAFEEVTQLARFLGIVRTHHAVSGIASYDDRVLVLLDDMDE